MADIIARGLAKKATEKADANTVQLASTEKLTIDLSKRTLQNLNITTFDSSDQPYHPSILYFSGGWNSFKYWMSYTPFPIGAAPYVDRWECPCIAVSNDGVNWDTPSGLTNPLVDLTAGEITRKDYFSDSCLVMNGSTMEVWYRKTNGANTAQTDIYRMTSTNGTTWTAPQMTLDSQNASNGINKIMRAQQLSFNGTTYRSYWADGLAGANPRTLSFADTTNPSSGIWTNYTICNLIGAPVGFNPWHTGMHIENGTYHLTVYDQGADTVNYFRSVDGVNFTFIKVIASVDVGIGGFVAGLYQAISVKVGSDWMFCSSMTYRSPSKNGYTSKNGLFISTGSSLENLTPVENRKFYKPTQTTSATPTRKDVAANASVNVSGATIIAITSVTAATITSLTGGVFGQEINLVNGTGTDVTLQRNLAANGIRTKSKTDFLLTSGIAIKFMAYSADSSNNVQWYEV